MKDTKAQQMPELECLSHMNEEEEKMPNFCYLYRLRVCNF